MRTAFAALLAITALWTPAAAQDDTGAAARGAACAMVGDSLQRLTCFDRAFPKSEASIAEPVPAAKEISLGAWQVDREKSAIDDSPKVTAYLIPNETQDGGLLSRGLIVRCVENTTSVIVATDDFQIGADTGTITYRLDDAPAITTRWAMSDNGSALGLWNGSTAIPFLKSLRGTTKLAVRTEMRKRVDMTFDVTGIASVVDEIAAACNWPAAE